MSALENATLPAIYAGVPRQQRQDRGKDLLTELGLPDRLHHKPTELSGEQQQRVSIARALMNGGEIILADEPTETLDSKSSQNVMDILQKLYTQAARMDKDVKPTSAKPPETNRLLRWPSLSYCNFPIPRADRNGIC